MSTQTMNMPIVTNEMLAAIKASPRVDLPRLEYWNYGPCEHHETARPDCEYRACGGELFDHQTVTAAWLFFRKQGLIASAPGVGKTNAILATLCLLKQYGMLKRALLVINTPAVTQWAAEAARFTTLKVAHVPPGLSKPKRLAIYASDYDVLLVGAHMMVQDHEPLAQLKPDFLLSDDVDPLLRHKTRTHKIFASLASKADRVAVVNFSSIQTELQNLHASMVPLGGMFIWGSLPLFERRYLLREWEEVRAKSLKTGKPIKGGRKVSVGRVVGIQNGEELRERLEPWVIRFTYDDVASDLSMPELMPPVNVWLDLHKAQRERYETLRSGVLEILRKGKDAVIRPVTAMTAFSAGQQICAGLPALGEEDGPGASVKLDWLVDRLMGAWTQEKVVVFAKNIGTIRALHARLDNLGVGYATMWGEESNAAAREAEKTRFWEDPNCRVFIGTSALERSLNLQVASIVVCVDLHLNPERVKQILGRVRRAGSKHKQIYTFSLLARDTQEEGYINVLQRREAVTSYVWDDAESVFEKLSPEDLLRLIRP